MILNKGYADLFTAPENYTIAHCVAFDFKLGAGIALQFRRRYPEMIPYLHENKTEWPGVVHYIANDGRQIYNIVTKAESHHKPTRENFEKALVVLRDTCVKDGVTHLAIPLIGAGLDRLEWAPTEVYINEIFKDTDIHIAVCVLKERSS